MKSVSVYQHPENAGAVVRLFTNADRTEFVEVVLDPVAAVHLSADLAKEAGRLLQFNLSAYQPR